jgi:hypothetical protein
VLDHVGGGIVDTLRDRVAYILNHYQAARNSDIELLWLYWELFDAEKFPGHHVSKEDMFALTRMPSLVRERARIQNQYRLFQADEEVRDYRGMLEEDARQQAVEDRPDGLPNATVYIDETGKTQNFLCVGGLWIPNSGIDIIRVKADIDDWRNNNNINYEFHFSDLSRGKLQNYKEFFARFIRLNPTAGFKIIVVKNAGFADLTQPIHDLTFHLLNRGIEHEHQSGRAPLPRLLQVWMDEDEPGTDALKKENIKERIKAQQIEGLYLHNVYTISSQSNYFIQAVDLFTGAVNRRLNRENNLNHKDDLADYILTTTGMQINEIDTDNTNADTAMVFNLSDFNL